MRYILVAILSAALALSGPSPSAAENSGFTLKDDVEPFDAALVSAKLFDGEVSAIEDRGNISVFSVSGNYARGVPSARTEVARRFFESHGDDYDFLVVFSTFEFDSGESLAFYTPVRNDVEGIGQTVFDHSASFGSAGRLQGYIDMAALGRYEFNARSSGFRIPLNTLAHELMHRWAVRMTHVDSQGEPRTDLLGREGAHWSARASTDASLMYGARWVSTGPGQWAAAEVRQRLSLWDLYLAGWAAANELQPIELLLDPSIDPDSVPEAGTAAQGPSIHIGIGDVIAAEGERHPGVSQAQREFDAALILLVRPGESPGPQQLLQLEQFRVAFERYFQAITLGRASIRLHLRPQELAAVGAPVPLTGSPIAAPSHPLEAAQAWLLARQQDDGRWEDRSSTAVRDTAATLEAIEETGVSPPSVTLARQWIDSRLAQNLDETARLLAARQDDDGLAGTLGANADGGLGILASWVSSPIDSYLALWGKSRQVLRDEAALSSFSAHLRAAQNADGSFSPTRSGAGRWATTAAIGESLVRVGGDANQETAQRARDWLEAETQPGFFEGGFASPTDVAELLLRASALGLSSEKRAALVLKLLAQQGASGDWGGSIYATAIASLALTRESRPNLAARSAVMIPVDPVQGETVRLRVRVANQGGQTSDATTLRWFDADPANGGEPVGDPSVLPTLLPGEETSVEILVQAPDQAGVHVWHAIADDADVVEETREDDNAYALEFDVSSAPDGVDLTIDARDLTFDPPRLESLPSVVHLHGTVRNLGLSDADEALIRAFHIRAGALERLGETRVSVAGRGATSFNIELSLVRAEAHAVRVVVDPDFELDESREDNNHAESTLPFSETIDLAVQADTLEFDPAPIVGMDTAIDLLIANRGTRESPLASVVLERRVAELWQPLATAALAIGPGEEVARRLVWRPDVEGTTELRVRVDPDQLVPETDEANNAIEFQQQPQDDGSAALGPVEGSLQIAPEPLLQGAPLQLALDVRNAGAGAAEAFSVAVYFGDPRSNGTRLGLMRHEPGLGAGAEARIEIAVDDYPGRGDGTVHVLIDAEHEIEERNEIDNLVVVPVTALGLPDLVVGTASIALVPDAPVVGAPVRAEILVSNQGEQDASAVRVRLQEIGVGASAPVSEAAILMPLDAGQSRLIEFEWIFGQVESVRAVSVEIDHDNELREGDETNNQATLVVDVQSGESFVTDSFFSPNGDGVKDSTRAVFADGTLVDRIEVFDHAGRLRRTLSPEPMGEGAVGATWDGQDERRRIVPDGRYRIQATSAQGSSIGHAAVVLDNNRAVALDAVGTADAVFRDFSDLPGQIAAGLLGSPVDGLMFRVVPEQSHPWPKPATPARIDAVDLVTGDTVDVLSAEWLARETLLLGAIELVPRAVMPLRDGSLLVTLDEVGNENRTLIYTADGRQSNAAALVQGIPRTDSLRLVGQAASGIVVLEVDRGRDVLLVDTATGGIISDVLHDAGTERGQIHVLSDYLVASKGDRVHVHDLADGSLRHEILHAEIVESQRSVQLVPITGRNAALWQIWTWNCESREFLDSIQYLDAAVGTIRPLVTASYPAYEPADESNECEPPNGSGIALVDERGPFQLRALWSDSAGQIFVVDHSLRALHRFDAMGRSVGLFPLPEAELEGPYSSTADDPDSIVWPGEIDAPHACECWDESLHGSWLDRSRGMMLERAVFDPDAEDVYLSLGQVVWAPAPHASEGIADYFILDALGRSSRIGGRTSSELPTPSGQASYPFVAPAARPPEWPLFIHSNGTQLREDGRIRIRTEGRTTPAWRNDRWVKALGRSESILWFGLPYDEAIDSGLVSLRSLTARLKAHSSGRSIQLSGIATDQNLAHFSIDWAHVSQPDAWHVLVPPTSAQIRFEEFIAWAAPVPGAYLFRLRVVDRAGNEEESYSTGSSAYGSSIINVRQDMRAISPNADGSKDTLTIQFAVLSPVEERVDVRSENGEIVRSDLLVFGEADLGSNEWSWDGRRGDGSPAPDGRYRIEFQSGHVIPVEVDRVAPLVEARLVDPQVPYSIDELSKARIAPMPGRGPVIDFDVTERFAGVVVAPSSVTWESAPAQASDWTSFVPFETNEFEGLRDQAILAAEQYAGRRFRLVAEDAAGNRSTAVAGEALPILTLLHAIPKPEDEHAQIVRAPYTVSNPIPHYALGENNVLESRPGRTPIAASGPVRFQLLQHLPPEDVVAYRLERQVASATGPVWSVVAAIGPDEVKPVEPVSAPFAGHLVWIDADPGLRRKGDEIALRFRAQRGNGAWVETNAFVFTVGGIEFSCFALDELGEGGGEMTPPDAFEWSHVLDGGPRDIVLEIGNVLPGICGAGPCADVIDEAADLTDVSLFGFQFESFSALRQKFGLTDTAVFAHRLRARDRNGVLHHSEWRDCRSSSYALAAAPSVGDSCGAPPRGRVRVGIDGRPNASLEHRLAISPVAGEPAIELPFDWQSKPLTITTQSLAEGNYRIDLQDRAVPSFAWQSKKNASFIVDRIPPEIEILSPASGERICLADWDRRFSARIDDLRTVGYQVRAESADGSLLFAKCGGMKLFDDADRDDPDFCERPLGSLPIEDFTFRGGNRLDVELEDMYGFQGDAVIRLHATDWSGAQVCEEVGISIDGAVQFESTGAATRRLTTDPRVLGLSHNGDPTYASVHIPWLAREAVSWSAALHPADRASAGAPPRISGAAIASLAAQVNAAGPVAFEWDGRINDAPVPDGLYGLRFRVVDDCGNTTTRDEFVEVDSNPPQLQLDSPQDGQSIRMAAVPILGSVRDPNFRQLGVAVSVAGPAGPWIEIAEHRFELPEIEVLGVWNTLGLSGPAWVRLRASDGLGNATSLVRGFELLTRPSILQAAATHPLLFSPGSDGRLDSTQISLSLGSAAVVDVRVTSHDGQHVREIVTSMPQPAGNFLLTWDGRDEALAVVADGIYRIEIEARDAASPTEVDTQTLVVKVDATPVSISELAPEGPFATCDGFATFTASDLHFERVEAELRGDTIPVASLSRTTPGSHEVASLLAVDEGHYSLEVVAWDRAGNESSSQHEFVLDCTPPELALDVAAAVARGTGEVVSVEGSVLDPNLAQYGLYLIPSDGYGMPDEVRIPLHESTSAVDAGLLLEWQPTQPDGEYALRLEATDLAGNRSTTESWLVIDGTPPVAQLDMPEPGDRLPGRFEVRGTATDEQFDQYRIELATAAQAAEERWSTLRQSYDAVEGGVLAELNVPFSGGHVLRLVVEDRVGLTSEARVPIHIDTTPPAALQLAGAVESGSIRLNWTAPADPDVEHVRVLRNGQELDRIESPGLNYLDVDPPAGDLRYHVLAVDQVGLVSEPSNSVTLNLDRTPPQVELHVADGAVIRGVFDLVGSVRTDLRDLQAWRLTRLLPDGTSQLLSQSELEAERIVMARIDTRVEDEGALLEFRLSAHDVRGNEAVVERRLQVDNLAPAAPAGLTAVDTAQGIAVQWLPNVEPDLLGYLLYRNGALVGTSGAIPADLRLFALPDNALVDVDAPDGTVVYRVFAIDRAGNVSEASPSAEVVRDARPPRLHFVRPQPAETFEVAIEALAESQDTDIAQVQFDMRAVGSGSWTALGSPVEAGPWRQRFEPGALPHGDYEIRAVAIDEGGQLDPAPPTVVVRYADLTPPAVPAGLQARAEGSTINLSWNPVADADLAGYRIERQHPQGHWQRVDAALAITTTFEDAGRALGEHRYRILAEDTTGNVSAPGTPATAPVFDLSLVQPYTPTAVASVAVSGRAGARGGRIEFRVEGTEATHSGEGPDVAAMQPFVLDALPLFAGLNRIDLSLRDEDGNRSIRAEVRVRLADMPSPPGLLEGDVDGDAVNLEWSASPSPGVLGYRLFRNGRARTIDANWAGPLSVSTQGTNLPALLDGDPDTGWEVRAPASSPSLLVPARIEVQASTVALLGELRLHFADEDSSVAHWRLLAWDADAGWVPLVERSGRRDVEESLHLPTAYPTSALRIDLLQAQTPGAAIRLREIELLQRDAIAGTETTDDAGDGRHAYTVTAINHWGLESVPSTEWIAEIGDSEPPPAVQLSGELVDGDAHLSWTASEAADVARYGIHRDGSRIATIEAGAPRVFVDAGLLNGSHTYLVFAEDTAFNASEPSNAVTLDVIEPLPGAPIIDSVEQPAGFHSLRVDWRAGPGAVPARYRLQVRRESIPDSAFAPLVEVAGTSYEHLQLEEGAYAYRVQAIDARGNDGPWSEPVSGYVATALPPSAPVLLLPTIAGEPIETDVAAIEVCGVASPGSDVIVARDGEIVGEAPAQPLGAVRELTFARGPDVAMAPDGRTLYVLTGSSASNSGWVDLSGHRVASHHQWAGEARALRMAANGESVVAINSGGTVARWGRSDPGDTSFGIFPEATAIMPAPDGGRMLIVLEPAAGEPEIVLAASHSDHMRVVPPSGQPLRAGSPAWRADGERFYFADMHGQLFAYHVEDAEVEPIPGDASAGGPWPARAGSDWIVAEQATRRIVRHGPDLAGPVVLIDELRIPLALDWSPDDTHFVALFLDGLEWRDAADGRLLHRIPIAGLQRDETYRLEWANWQRLLLVSSAPEIAARVIERPGAFCLPNVALNPGVNLIEAIAENEEGLLSLPSLPIRIDRILDLEALPNLWLNDEETFFFPAAPDVGERRFAYVGVATDGTTMQWDGVLLRGHVELPDGTRRHVQHAGEFELQEWSTTSVPLDLGPMSIAGAYRLVLDLDPDGRLDESDESDNAMEVSWTVDDSRHPRLSFEPWRTLSPPGEYFEGDLSVFNPGASFTGRIRIDLIGTDGVALANLVDAAVTSLGSGQVRRWSWYWDIPMDVLDGDYRVRAQLENHAGAVVADEQLQVEVRSEASFRLQLQPARVRPALGETLPVQIGVDYEQGNRVFTSGMLRLIARPDGGAEQVLWQGATGALLPGYSLRRTVHWMPAEQVSGWNTLRLEFTAADHAQQLVREIEFAAPDAAPPLRGELSLSPSPQWILGQESRLSVRIENPSSDAVSDASYRIRVHAEGGEPALLETTASLDLGAGAAIQSSHPLAGLPPSLRGHLARLEARLASDPPGTWRRLDSLAFQGVDGLAPEIRILTPDATRPVRMPAPIIATATDRHSRVDRLEYRIDQGSWRQLGAFGTAAYQATIQGLADGLHRIDVKARDTWGNESRVENHGFTVDSTPPLILVDGVEPAARLNVSVQALIGVEDVHPDELHAWLDGHPYTSGTTVDSEGEHRLLVIARDLAGNRSERQLDFTLDFTPPDLSFVTPASDGTTRLRSIAVSIETEALSEVRLQVGALNAETIADAGGIASFPSVPLVPGMNLLEATARDAAGNTSAPRQRTIEREPLSGVLAGEILPASESISRGDLLTVALQLDNGTEVDRVQLLLRLTAIAPGSVIVHDETLAMDVVSGDIAQVGRSLATASWPWGPVSLVLEVDEGEGWRALDSQLVQVLDTVAPLVELQAPAAGSLQPRTTAVLALAQDDRGVAQVETRIGAGAWEPLSPSEPGAYRGERVLPDGEHEIQVRARDASDNAGTSPSVTFTVDGTPPTVVFSGVAPGAVQNTAVSVEVEVLDAHPGMLALQLDGADYVAGTVIDTHGAHEILALAIDAVGNRHEATLAFELDFEAPDLIVSHPVAGQIVDAPQVLVLATTEPHAQVRVSLGSFEARVQADATGAIAVPDVPLDTGENRLRAQASDAAGNTGAELEVLVYRSSTGPLGLSGTLLTDPVDVAEGAAFDVVIGLAEGAGLGRSQLPTRLQVRAASGPDVVIERFAPVDLAAHGQIERREAIAGDALERGMHVATLAVQLDGEWRELSSLGFEVADVTPPVVSIIAPAPNSVHGVDLEVRALATDASGVAQVQARADGGSWLAMTNEGGAWVANLPLSREGEIAIDVRARDAVGNLSPTSGVSIRSDQTPPLITIEGASDGQRRRDPVIVAILVSDDSATEVSATMNGQPFVSGGEVSAEGEHALHVVATDEVGFVAEARLEFEIDRTAPSLAISHPLPGSDVLVNQIDILGSGEAGATIELLASTGTRSTTVDGAGAFQIPSVELTPAWNHLRLRAIDDVGNASDWLDLDIRWVCGHQALVCPIFADGFESRPARRPRAAVAKGSAIGPVVTIPAIGLVSLWSLIFGLGAVGAARLSTRRTGA